MSSVSIVNINLGKIGGCLQSEGEFICLPELVVSATDQTITMELNTWVTGLLDELLDFLYGIASGISFAAFAPERMSTDDEVFDAAYAPLFRADGEAVTVGIADYLDAPYGRAVPWRDEELPVKLSVPVAQVVSDTVAIAENIISQINQYPPKQWQDRVARVEAKMQDARELLSHVTETGSIAGYRIERARAESYLFEDSHENRLLSHCIVNHGALDYILEELVASGRTQSIIDLINRDPVVRRQTVDYLDTNRTAEGIQALLATRWTDDPVAVPSALRIIVEEDHDAAQQALLEVIEISEVDEVREAAVDLLRAYPSQDSIETLEEVAETDPSEQVRNTAAAVLDTVDPAG